MKKALRKLRVLLYTDGIEEGFKKGHLKFFKSILKNIGGKYVIEEIWVCSVGGKIINKYEEGNYEYNVFGFKNAFDILDKLKPDLILLTNTQEHIQRSILIAGKFIKIPSVVIKTDNFNYLPNEKRSKIIIKRISMLFLKPSPSWPILGILISKKYYFLIKTLKKIGRNIFSILVYLIKDILKLSKSYSIELQNDDADLYLVNNSDWLDYGKKVGIDENKIKVIGEIIFDDDFDKISKLKKVSNSQLEILFLTAAIAEHGFWSFAQRDKVISKVILGIKNNLFNYNLKIKIHPTSETLEHYKKIIEQIAPKTKIYQKEDLIELINQSDVVIALGDTGALYSVVLLKKPIILINLYNNEWFFANQKFVNEYKSIKEMINFLKNEKFSINIKDYEEFIDKSIHKFDGKCGERAADYIFKLLGNQK